MPVSVTTAGVTAVDFTTRADALPDDAIALFAEAEAACVELGLPWFANLAAQVFHQAQDQVRFYMVRRGGALQAVLPVRAETPADHAGGVTALHGLANFYTALYAPLCAASCTQDDLAAVLLALRRDFPRAGSLKLAPMDPASTAWSLLQGGLRQSGWKAFAFFAFGNWHQRIDQSWPDYLAAREGVLRSTIKRAGKKFANAGGTLELITAPADVARGAAAWEKVYNASWKKPEPYPGFMPGLLQTYAEKGMLRLGVAWLDGEPIAAQVWIVGNGTAEIYKLAYDEAYKSHASGTLLTAMLMQHAIDIDRVSLIDYLIGDDVYKQAWTRDRRERFGIMAFNPRTPSGLLGWLRELAARAVKGLRKPA
jgi:hypothetical protein